MAVKSLWHLNDNVIKVVGLQNPLDGTYLNAATVTVTLQTEAGAEVAGQSWPTTMSYVTGSNGEYRANLVDTLSITKRNKYKAIIEADAGSNLKGHWVLDLIAVERSA